MSLVATQAAIDRTDPARAQQPNTVSVGTIVWLASELMFFAGLFAIYFTVRAVQLSQGGEWPTVELSVLYDTSITIVLVLSSVTCQLGVFAAERGDVRNLRVWFVITIVMGLVFVVGQGIEMSRLILHDGLTMSSGAYGSVFYITTGFHGLHVCGGLLAFMFMLGRTYAARRFTHEQAVSAVVVSYYWHFVDVIWIGLYLTIFQLQ